MYACAELFCVLTNVCNKFVFRRFPLRGSLSPSAPLRAPLGGCSGVQRSGDARDDCFIGCPHYQILALSSGIWWLLLLDVRCLWRHNMTSYARLQANVLTKFLTQHAYPLGRRSSGSTGGAVKQLRAMETYKKQKSLPICLFVFINNVHLKNNNRNYIKSFWIL